VALIAALTAVALSVAFAGPAVAAEPGEWGSWSEETVNNHYMQVASQGTLSEARNGGNLLEVWREATNDQVWMSLK
jgi:ABC-type sugar transport system substrate-binding protein